MVWKPKIILGGICGAAIIGVISIFDRWCLQRLSTAPVDLTFFFLALAIVLSIFIVVLMVYLLYGLLSLSYILDRNGLVIRWGPLRQVVPMGNIERIVPAEEVHVPMRFYGVAWPGYRVGRGYVKGLGSLHVYATCPLRDQLLVITPSQVYGISPSDPQAFLTDFDRRAGLGLVHRMEQITHRSAWASMPIWTDRQAQALIFAGFLINLWLVAYICNAYPELPHILPLHFDSLGEVDRVGERAELFILPLIGWIVQMFDTLAGLLLHPRQTAGSYLLFVVAVLVQALLWAAVVTIVL
ncbi:MAG: PH domain-containing protein [Chloroflexota bacterium]